MAALLVGLLTSCTSGSPVEPVVVADSSTTLVDPTTTTSSVASATPTSASPATTTIPSTTTTTAIDTGDIEGYELTTIQLNGEDLLVAVADDVGLRAQGLMGVSSFGDVDGMLFAWPTTTSGAFWMWTVPIPLDVAFFDSDGRLVEVITMAPCVDGSSPDCPRYRPNGGYQFALEDHGGDLIGLSPDSRISVDLSALFQP